MDALTWILLTALIGAALTAAASLWVLFRIWRELRVGTARHLADLRDEHPQPIPDNMARRLASEHIAADRARRVTEEMER